MKSKHISILIAFCLVGALVNAQEATVTAATAAPAAEANKATEQAQKAIEAVAAHQTVVQEVAVEVIQPTTVVEAQPLATSSADQMRKEREEAELQTEQRIAEKLEQSRLQDEKRRLEVLFGGGLNSANKKEETTNDKSAPQVIVVNPPVSAPAVPVVEQVKVSESVTTPAPTIDEVREVVKSELQAQAPEKKDKSSRMFMTGHAGMLDYESDMVDTKSSFGISIGSMQDTHFSVELDLLYSNIYVDDILWTYRELNQYNLGATARYNFQLGKFRPNVGVTASYTRREYSAPRDYIDGYPYSSIGTMTSNAFDAGLVAGVGILVSENIEIGLEYRYMQNLSYKYENDDELNAPGYRASNSGLWQLEDQSYDIWTIGLRVLF